MLVTVVDPTSEQMDRLFEAVADAAYATMPEPDVSGFPANELAKQAEVRFPAPS